MGCSMERGKSQWATGALVILAMPQKAQVITSRTQVCMPSIFGFSLILPGGWHVVFEHEALAVRHAICLRLALIHARHNHVRMCAWSAPRSQTKSIHTCSPSVAAAHASTDQSSQLKVGEIPWACMYRPYHFYFPPWKAQGGPVRPKASTMCCNRTTVA